MSDHFNPPTPRWRGLWLSCGALVLVTAWTLCFPRGESQTLDPDASDAMGSSSGLTRSESPQSPPRLRSPPPPRARASFATPAPSVSAESAPGSGDATLLPPPIPSEESEDREYARDRRELMFEELEAALLGEAQERARSEQLRAEVVERLTPFGAVAGVTAECRATLCKIVVPVANQEMASRAEFMPVPPNTEQIVKISGDGARGVIERVELYRLSRARLTELIGEHPEEAIAPGTLVATPSSPADSNRGTGSSED